MQTHQLSVICTKTVALPMQAGVEYVLQSRPLVGPGTQATARQVPHVAV